MAPAAAAAACSIDGVSRPVMVRTWRRNFGSRRRSAEARERRLPTGPVATPGSCRRAGSSVTLLPISGKLECLSP
jgi:hypothetical protein